MNKYAKLKAKIVEQQKEIVAKTREIEEIEAEGYEDRITELEAEIKENEDLIVDANKKIETLEKDTLGGGEKERKAPMSKEEKEKAKKALREKLK